MQSIEMVEKIHYSIDRLNAQYIHVNSGHRGRDSEHEYDSADQHEPLRAGWRVLAPAGEFEFVHAEGLALGAEDRESSLAGAGKCSELLAA
jgi:hypothetical protein